jgi:hypothetical protein
MISGPDPFQGLSELMKLSERLPQSVAPLANAELLAQEVSAVFRQEERWRSGMEAMENQFRRNLPDNWHETEIDIMPVIDAIKDSGICLVWTPRAELVDAIVAERDTPARYALLTSEREALLTDLEAVLDTARDVNLAGHGSAASFAREAIEAAREGHMTAAQALAACGLARVIHESFGWKRLGEMHKRFKDSDPAAVKALLFKATLLGSCTARALIDTEDASPEGFNRHATLHGHRSFFSDANALTGVMLLVGWIREFKWISDHHPQMFISPRIERSGGAEMGC